MATTPTPAQIREFVIAGHGQLAKVQAMLAAQPALLHVAHEWRPGDTESAIQGAAHVGNRAIVEFLLAQGAPLEICTAAMLGRAAEVDAMLATDATLINAQGAHHIPLLAHAVLSGDVDFVASLYQRGATAGATLALNMVAARGDHAMAIWLLEHAEPDLSWRNFQGKTAAEAASAGGYLELAERLQAQNDAS